MLAKENFVILSARNLKNVKVMGAKDLNTYQIMHANTLVFSESAVKELDNANANE